MKATLWNALGIASKDKAVRLTLVDVIGKIAIFHVGIVDRKSGRELYGFEPMVFEKKNDREQQSVTIGLDVECEINAEGVAQLLQDGQSCEIDKNEKEKNEKES